RFSRWIIDSGATSVSLEKLQPQLIFQHLDEKFLIDFSENRTGLRLKLQNLPQQLIWLNSDVSMDYKFFAKEECDDYLIRYNVLIFPPLVLSPAQLIGAMNKRLDLPIAHAVWTFRLNTSTESLLFLFNLDFIEQGNIEDEVFICRRMDNNNSVKVSNRLEEETGLFIVTVDFM
ncbi:hypothetical protein PFISCL1PPCAC_2914, partial [Pristionchus fissidentatus]